MNIVFDLDGTLLDARRRLYFLFQELAPASPLSFDEYWNLKRRKISNETILVQRLLFEPPAVETFVARWMELIESQRYLSLDTALPGLGDKLATLSGRAKLYVCTARQFREPVLEQLASLGLSRHFTEVFVTQGRSEKEALIRAGIAQPGHMDWLVGDTGSDIRVGKALRMKTCGVLSGFLGEDALREYHPDLLIDSVLEFPLSELQ